jgi:hypothetical protein
LFTLFDTGSHNVAQAALELPMLLAQSPKCSYNRCASQCKAQDGYFTRLTWFDLKQQVAEIKYKALCILKVNIYQYYSKVNNSDNEIVDLI